MYVSSADRAKYRRQLRIKLVLDSAGSIFGRCVAFHDGNVPLTIAIEASLDNAVRDWLPRI